MGMVSLQAVSGANPLILKDIVEGKFAAKGVSAMQAMPDGEHYAVLSADGKAILKCAYTTGEVVETLFHVDEVRETKLDAIQGYALDSRGFRILVWNDKEGIYRRSWKAHVYDYDVRRNYLKPLSDTKGKVMIPTFSPDGRMAAFVRDNNIWLKKFDFDTEIQITKDGSVGKILNGITDWVYEEEFSQTNMLSWSSDSRFLAYLKSDETDVPTHSFQVFDGSLHPDFHTYKYPKAGENNSQVACYVYNIDTRDTKKMQVPLDADGYIPRIAFTPNIDQLAVMTLNRHQSHFRMYFVNPLSTIAKQVLSDKSEQYIPEDWILEIAFSPNNFVYVSEKDGFAHIYMYSMTGVLEKQVTTGKWDVTRFYGFNPDTKAIYYQSAEESPLRRSVYKIDAKGVKTKLSAQTGTNSANFSPNYKYFVNTYSNITTPNFITIRDEQGKELVVLNDNRALKTTLAGMRLPTKEFFTFTSPTGDVLNGWLIKPSHFDASKRYPVLMAQYSGPNSQEVLDAYKPTWENYLAEQGYVIACVDGRGTGARGTNFRKCTYLNLGVKESDDQIAAAQYLANQPFIDRSRIAVWGWSYGGFNTLMALSRSTGVFKAGIAVAPVTDWKFYDTVYAERYMRTPKENPRGYTAGSPLELAGSLNGNLLIVHGTSDDNVHITNTLDYTTALVKAGKNFEMQIYPNKNHSLPGNDTRLHLYNRIIKFLEANN
ncbi:peptidase S9 [Bacteroidia bacterium]|nr:peptidase S9 [Bacteroidia bacterium]